MLIDVTQFLDLKMTVEGLVLKVFSCFFSFMLYAHFGYSHITNVMVADVSDSNLHLMLEAMGIPMLAETCP